MSGPSPLIDRGPTGGDPVGLVFFTNVLVKNARLIGGVALLVTSLATALVLVLPSRYRAEGSFVPEQARDMRLPGGLAALATQFGLAFSAGTGESPHFYAEVLRSREVTDQVLESVFLAPNVRSDSARLLELLRVRGRSRADSLYRARRRIAKVLGVTVDQRSGIITVTFTSRDPHLSAGVVNRYLELLNEFNLGTRQFRGRRRREFVEERVRTANVELRAVEERLKDFVVRNQLWEQSPDLRVEYGRLEREVQVAQQTYLTLKREHEMARVEEVNDTPVLTVVDRAVPPARRSFPRRGMTIAVALVVGTVLGLAVGLLREYLARLKREGSEELEELEARIRRLAAIGKRRTA